MNPININLAVLILTIFPVLRLLGKYFTLYTNYMLDIPFKWNSTTEKTRLFVYSLIIPILLFLRIDLLNSLNKTSPYILTSQIIIISTFIVSVGFLYLPWTPIFKHSFLKHLKRIVITISNNSNYTILNTEEKITNTHNKLNKKYLQCSLETFLCLLSQSTLNASPKIKWIDTGNKKNTYANQQSLVLFICKIFPNRAMDNKFIKNTISNYFCDGNGKSIEITAQAISTNKKLINNIQDASENLKQLISKIDNDI